MSETNTAKPFTSAAERDAAFRSPKYAPERPNGSGPNPQHDAAYRAEVLARMAATEATGRKLS